MVQWRKSSHSGGVDDEACVEVARLPNGFAGLRDSKRPDSGHLSLIAGRFTGLLERIKGGELNS
jgi:hypothetical protein